LTITANGRDIPLSAAGTATFTFEEWRFTRINTIARAVDTNGNVTEKSVVFDYDFPEGWGGSDPQVIPTAIITSPANTASVTGMVSIVGTAAHADFAAYKLSYRRVDQTEFTEFFESTTAVTNGTLGVWDTSLLLNDEYVIRLEVATNAGVVNVVENNLGLAGELKLGNFRLSFTDMVIPVAGIPIEITRIYDTLQADREGDFGFGWRLEYRNTDLQVGLPRSGLEDIGIFSALREGVKVYLNVPGEGRQGFTFTPDIRVLPGFGGTNLVLARPRFTPDPGVTARLSAGTSSYLQVNERGELHAPGGIPYNPASPDFGGAYVLTTRDGTTYRINGSTGNLESAIDRNKNTLLYTDDGIFQFVIEGASSVAIAISRDSLGHITEIRDPAGESFYYAYANNRIIESRDQLGNTTQYVYESIGSNRLLSVLDSLGRVGIRSEYDAEGRLSAYIGANGQRIDLQFNSSNRIQSITDPLGNETLVGLDQYGNEVLERDSLGNSITRTFDSKNQIETVTDKLGNTSRYKYNAFGDVISRTDSAGNMVRFEYNPRGDIVSSLNAQGARSETQRDTAGNATRIVDASGLTTDIRYDAKGNATAFNGVLNRTSLKYNSHGFISKEVDSRGNLQQHDFDSLGRVRRSTTQLADGRLAVESKLFDASGNLIKSTDALGGSTEYSYNSVGQLIARKDLLGVETSYAYDVEGRLVKTIFADATPLDNTDNPFVATKYDAIGRPVESIDELGRIAKFVYDALGNLIEEQYPDSTISDEDNPRRKFEYDANGRLLASISELGSRTEYTYESVGNRVTFRNAAGQLWRFEYDSTGRRTSQFDPAGNRTQFRYDAAGKLIGQSFPDDSSAALEVNTSQRSYSKTERDGSKILSEYSENSELIRSVDESGAAWAFVYDSFGNLASITNAQGNTTIDSFDLLGRPVRSTKPTGDSSSARYDAVGNIVESIDYNGSVTRYSYDARYRLIEVNYADTSTTRYEYDLVGNRTAIVGENGRTEFQYDERYRLVQQLNPDQTWIRYEYDLASNRAAIITPFGRTGYQFDLLNRISRVIAPDDGQTNYQYNELGLLINTNFANGVIEKRSYDSRGYVLAIETTNRETSIAKWTYQYNVLSQRTSATNSDRSSVNYTYDPTGRIIREAYRSPALIETRVVEYAYDSVGNRIKKTENGASVTLYTYDRNDRLVRLESNGNASTFQYDANGNLVGESTNGISVKAYRFDRRDRLDAVDGNGDGQFEINYAYDELGNRTSKTVNGSTTNYLVDSLRQNAEVIAEYRDPQVADVIYVFGNRLLTQLRAETAAFYHTDGLGSVRVLTTQSGVVANEYEFSAFGELLLSSGTTVNDYLFAGQRRDAETGLDYLRARYLNSVVGRFISQDPFPAQIQRTNAINGYAYAEGNPLTLVDPSGLTTSTAELSVVQTIIQGISKGTGSFRAAKAIKQRAEIAHQVVFLVSAGIHAAVFYLIDLKFPLPGTVEADVSIGFVHETSSDLWVKKVKLSLNPLKKETEIEIGLGRIGAEKKGDKGVDPSIGIKFCGGSICGSKIGLSYDIVTIPQAKRGADGDLDGALLAIAAKAEAGVARDRSKPSKQQISGDVTFGFEAVAFGTLKYSAKLFSAQAIANLFNKK